MWLSVRLRVDVGVALGAQAGCFSFLFFLQYSRIMCPHSQDLLWSEQSRKQKMHKQKKVSTHSLCCLHIHMSVGVFSSSSKLNKYTFHYALVCSSWWLRERLAWPGCLLFLCKRVEEVAIILFFCSVCPSFLAFLLLICYLFSFSLGGGVVGLHYKLTIYFWFMWYFQLLPLLTLTLL